MLELTFFFPFDFGFETTTDGNANDSDAGINSKSTQDHTGMSWHLSLSLPIFFFRGFIL